MASTRSIVDLIVDLASDAGAVRSRAMFGEYAIYCDDKLVALICDNRLFVKQVAPAEALLPDAEHAAPYPGAKPHLVVPEEMWEEPGFLSRLAGEIASALPAPKPKRPRKTKGSA